MELESKISGINYEFNCLVFGINSPPFLALFVSQYHIKRYEKQYPIAAEVILKSTYVRTWMIVWIQIIDLIVGKGKHK